MFLALEICLTAVCLSFAYTRPPLGDAVFGPVERCFARFARRKRFAVAAVGLLALGIRLALIPIFPIPAPCIHDEFSHLLLSDTLAHGRLSNPTHPMWIHFETFHVNWHPVYASMYYPGHALFLAFGQVVFGNAFWGVWLSGGVMCVAICWALEGWMPAEWALFGGLLAMIRLATFSYWVDSYWGGTTAAIGGALVLGAFPRIKERPNIRDSVLLGLGIALVALTRPYEGIFYCAPIVTALLFWAARYESPKVGSLLARVAAPAVLTLAVGLGWMGFYFWRVTGSPFTTPYQVNIRTYGLVFFPWQQLGPTAPFHHIMMQRFYRDVSLPTIYNFALQHPFELQGLKALVIWFFFFGPLLTMPWFAWLCTCRQNRPPAGGRKLRFLLIVCAAGYLPMALTIYVGQPHYAAPLSAAFYAATLLAMRDVAGMPSGRWLVRCTAIVAVLLFAAITMADVFHHGPQPSWLRTWCTPQLQNLDREHVRQALLSLPGKHLVIVRYRPDHDFAYDEWVFNGADIDGSKVIWARDMGSQNAELLGYFRNRKIWLVEADKRPIAVIPYEINQAPIKSGIQISQR
jgi:hypothetical protein